MLHLYMSRKVSAAECCVACYWAGLSGVLEARLYGKAPSLATGKYNEHLKSLLGYTAGNERLYSLAVRGKDGAQHDAFNLRSVRGACA